MLRYNGHISNKRLCLGANENKPHCDFATLHVWLLKKISQTSLAFFSFLLLPHPPDARSLSRQFHHWRAQQCSVLPCLFVTERPSLRVDALVRLPLTLKSRSLCTNKGQAWLNSENNQKNEIGGGAWTLPMTSLWQETFTCETCSYPNCWIMSTRLKIPSFEPNVMYFHFMLFLFQKTSPHLHLHCSSPHKEG